jgi:hypothetical protein
MGDAMGDYGDYMYDQMDLYTQGAQNFYGKSALFADFDIDYSDIDVHQERANMEHISRLEAKEKNLMDIYKPSIDRFTGNAEQLEARAARLLEYAADARVKAQRLADEEDKKSYWIAEHYGEDIYETGNIIHWEMSFQYHGNTKLKNPTGRVYQYAAIKADSLWFTTGPKSPKAYTWDELTTWFEKNKVEQLWFVTEMNLVEPAEQYTSITFTAEDDNA